MSEVFYQPIRLYYESRGYSVEWVSTSGNIKINGKEYAPNFLLENKAILADGLEERWSLSGFHWMMPEDTIGFALGIKNEEVQQDSPAVGALPVGKRMEFIFNGESYEFVLNPEDYSQVEVSRSTITQTLGGYWLDFWGPGLTEITMSGTTGFKNNTELITAGFDKFVALRDLVRKVFTQKIDNSSVELNPAPELLEYYNFTDEEYYKVWIKRFVLKRSVSKPMMYFYDINMICLQDLKNPVAGSSANLVITDSKSTSINGDSYAPDAPEVTTK